MRSRIRNALNVRANGPWILAAALLVALMVAPFAGAVRRRQQRARRRAQPVSRRAPGVHEGDADHRQREHVRHAPVEQVQQRRRRRLRLPLGRRRHAEGQRALRARQQPGRRPRVRVQRQRRHRGRRHHRPGDGGAVHDDRQRRGHRPERRQGRRQERDEITAALQAKFATVSDAGALADQRGATAAARSAAGVYSVTFNADVSKCARTVSINGDAPGIVTTRRRPAPTTVAVHTFDILPAAPRPTTRSTSSSPASRLTTDRALARAPRRSARGARSGRPRRRRGGRPGRSPTTRPAGGRGRSSSDVAALVPSSDSLAREARRCQRCIGASVVYLRQTMGHGGARPALVLCCAARPRPPQSRRAPPSSAPATSPV